MDQAREHWEAARKKAEEASQEAGNRMGAAAAKKQEVSGRLEKLTGEAGFGEADGRIRSLLERSDKRRKIPSGTSPSSQMSVVQAARH